MSALEAGSEIDTYVYLGHGNEEAVPYEEREVVPEGSTVVSFTKPGEGIHSTVTNKIISIMRTNPGLFKDPVQNKEEIERITGEQIRIYKAGSLMPTLHYYPVNDGPGARGQWNFYASGVYKLPLQYFNNLYETIKFSPLDTTKLEGLFQGDPNQSLLQTLLSGDFRNQSGRPSLEKLQNFEYPAIDMIGPGVHYFLNCRGVKGLRQRVETFFQDLVRDLDKREEDLNLYLQLESVNKEALEYIHRKVINSFKQSLLALKPRVPALTSENLAERKLEGIRKLLESRAPKNVDNIYENKDNQKICTTMIPKICEKIRSLEVHQSNDIPRSIVDEVFEQENPVAWDRSIMTALILTPIQKKYAQIFDEIFGALQTSLPVTRQLSNSGQAQYATTRRGGKRKQKQKQKRRKTQRRQH